MHCFECCHVSLKVALLRLKVSLETSKAILGMLTLQNSHSPLQGEASDQPWV